MRADPRTEDFRLNLPADLLSALDRRPIGPRDELRIEGWRPTFLGRILERLTGGRRR